MPIFQRSFADLKSTVEYSIGKYQIRINIWLLILFLIMQTILNELGFWQLNRAKEKQIRLYQIEQGGKQSLKDLSQVGAKNLEQFQQLELSLETQSDVGIFVDNKTHNKAPGYHLLTLVKDKASNKLVLVNRGWIFGGGDRNVLPKFDRTSYDWRVKGRLYPVTDAPSTALAGKTEFKSDGIRIPFVSTETLKDLEKEFNLSIEPYLIRLDKDNEFALEVDWQWTNMPVEKHLAYAIQWFGLALALLVISFIVAVKKKKVK